MQSALSPFLRSSAASDGSVTGWRFESRYFSSFVFFSLNPLEGSERQFVAKFPKVARGRGHKELPRRLSEDVALSALEYEACRRLAETWPKDNSEFVQPVFHDPTTGLLVFPYVAGEDVFLPSLARQLAAGKAPVRFLDNLRKLGSSLGAYHARWAESGEFLLDRLVSRIEKSGREFGVPLPRWLPVHTKRSAALVPGIRGFEVRNARSDGDRVWLFDPGRLREEPAEADLARFLVSLRMLTWGTVYFPVPIDAKEIEQAFLASYRKHHSPDAVLLRLFMLRELSWNWTEFVEVTKLKRLPAVLTRLVIATYVNPVFRRHWRLLITDEKRNLLS